VSHLPVTRKNKRSNLCVLPLQVSHSLPRLREENGNGREMQEVWGNVFFLHALVRMSCGFSRRYLYENKCGI
jgi:hypothetical protein